MYARLPQSSGDVLGYRIEGRLTQQEVEQIQRDIEAVVREHGSFRVLGLVEGLEVVEPAAVWQDLRMTPQYVRTVERIAVVGDERWQEWMTKLSAPFAEARYFSTEDVDRAWDWIQEGRPGGARAADAGTGTGTDDAS